MSTPKAQLDALTSIRFYAILWIILFHYHFIAAPTNNETFTHIMQYAYVALDTFFILSGFIISYVYFDKFNAPHKILKNTPRFLCYRFGRIYPLHLITLLFSYLAYKANWFYVHEAETDTFIMQLLLIQGWFQASSLSWNYPSWSVSMEWLIYLCYPFLAYLFLRCRNIELNLWLFGGISLTLFVMVFMRDLPPPVGGRHHYGWTGGEIERAFLEFSLGIIMFNLRHAGFMKNRNHDLICFTLLVIIFAGILFGVTEAALLPLLPFFVLSLSQLKGKMLIIFANKPAVFLGDSAYSLYLWHVPVGHYFWKKFAEDEEQYAYSFGQLEPYSYIGTAVITVIIVSILSNHFIEKPFRRLTKKLLYGNKNTAATIESPPTTASEAISDISEKTVQNAPTNTPPSTPFNWRNFLPKKSAKEKTVSGDKKTVHVSYKNRAQIAPLTSIRAFAIIWIIIYHYHFYMPPLDNWYAQQMIRYAFICLDLFFMLSGFILSYVYFNKFNSKKLLKENAIKFHLYRLSRIYPLHMIVLFTFLILQLLNLLPLAEGDIAHVENLPPNQGDTMTNFLSQLFIVHGFGFGNPINWNLASWSVSTEWLFYIFFPLLAFGFHKIRSNAINCSLLIALCAWLYYYVDGRPLDYNNGIALYGWVADIPRAMTDCIMGIILGTLYVNRFLEHWKWDAILSAIGVIWIVAVLVDAPEGVFFPFIPLILLGLCYIKGFLLRFLSWHPFVVVGEAAYSLYLWHIPYIFVIVTLLTRFGFIKDHTSMPWYSMIPLLVVLIFLSISSNENIEKPFRKIMKKYVK